MKRKSKDITMRLPGSIGGLKEMIAYINKITDTKKLKLLEIGAFHGDSTVVFAEQFKEVTTIDPWKNNSGDISNSVDMQEVFEDFLHNTEPFENIKSIRAFSYDAIKKLKKKRYDVLYVDGMHDYKNVKRDLELFKGLVKPGGFICGHDYVGKFPGVVKAVREVMKKIPDETFRDWSYVYQVSERIQTGIAGIIEEELNNG